MESIKHKMDCLLKEKEDAVTRANESEAICNQFESELARFEKEVDKVQRAIAKTEDDLDITISTHKTTQDKLEVIDKEVVDAELQVGALKRRIALLEEETSRCSLRLNENLEKIATIEQSYNENEEGKRIAEQQSFQNEEAAEQMESQLEEARQIATTSNHKYEDSERKLKIVSNDLERIIERGDEFDGKCRATEDELRQLQDKAREMDQIVADNSVKEDEYEGKVKDLQEEFKLADTRAEFAERSVDKLESTIDDLINSLYQEKLNFRDISEKLDKTLNDMMSLQ
ncbi:unnamed protein product [Oikopleura dioica]|uniref:Tropomyosin n=1 Tax=Oikopleura dioica TaxID=34765 RepID=E4WU29_OIKDI|nr:unnamed protein product [Oikopleura dioica]